MARNPHKSAKEQAERVENQLTAERAIVVSKPDDGSHFAIVRVESTGADEPCAIAATARGDNIPVEVGDRVLCVRRNEGKLVIVDVLYAEGDSPPNHEDGERVVGHPASDATVRLRPDGSVRVVSDDGTQVVVENGSVRVNQGTRRPIVDVDFSNNTVTRAKDIYLP